MHHRAVFLTLALVLAFGFGRAVQAETTVGIDQPAAPVALVTAALQLTVGFSQPSVAAPGTVDLTFIVTNTGDTTAHSVAIDNALPVEFSYADAAAAKTLRALGDLASGDTVTKTLTITVPSSASADRYVDEAIASATNADSIQTDAPLDVTKGKVLGAETTLAASGQSPLMLLFLGAVVVTFGILSFRKSS